MQLDWKPRTILMVEQAEDLISGLNMRSEQMQEPDEENKDEDDRVAQEIALKEQQAMKKPLEIDAIKARIEEFRKSIQRSREEAERKFKEARKILGLRQP